MTATTACQHCIMLHAELRRLIRKGNFAIVKGRPVDAEGIAAAKRACRDCEGCDGKGNAERRYSESRNM